VPFAIDASHHYTLQGRATNVPVINKKGITQKNDFSPEPMRDNCLEEQQTEKVLPKV